MRIQFIGAARTVTGSAHLLDVNGRKILLDCGLYQGRREEARRINEAVDDDFHSLDAVILSHGHLDHCGRLPLLSRIGYGGPIHCTDATLDVTRVVLEDSAKIQVEDAEYLNRRCRESEQCDFKPLYTPGDVSKLKSQFRRTKLGERIDLGGGVGATLFDAGHILGSTYIWIDWSEAGEERNLLFTADVGRYDTPIIHDPTPPPGACDVLITESTYGGRTHGPVDRIEPDFVQLLKETMERKGRLIIPSFAVGRTQTMLFLVEKAVAEGKIPPIRVYVDSPMGVELTNIYGSHRDLYDAQTRDLIGKKDLFGIGKLTLASSSQQSRRINDDHGPCVIIASSPTCEFGRVLHHLKVSLERESDTVLFVGWTPPHTLGRRLQEGAQRARIYNRFYDVRCRITTLHGMSAHADGDELIRFLKPALAQKTRAYVVHGEPDQAGIFAKRLVESEGVHSAAIPAAQTEVMV